MIEDSPPSKGIPPPIAMTQFFAPNWIRLKERCRSSHGWTDPYSDRVLKEYCKFLHLKALCRDYQCLLLVPSEPIGLMWQHHIIDTQHYMTICFSCFGAIIHFDPEMRGALVNEQRRIDSTRYAYQSHFGVSAPYDIWYFAAEQTLQIHFLLNGVDTVVKARMGTSMQIILDSFATHKNIDGCDLLFYLRNNSQPLYGDGTPATKGLKNGEVIDCVRVDMRDWER